MSDRGEPFFPNATFRCASADLEFFMRERQERFIAMFYALPEADERLAPVADRIETWETDRNLFRGVDVRLAPGHTPGSSVVVLSDGEARAMLLGDMVHCPLELSEDDFDLLVDVDMELAQRTRVAYAREARAWRHPGRGVALPGAALRSAPARRWSPTLDLRALMMLDRGRLISGCAIDPPSTGSTTPVRYCPSDDARNKRGVRDVPRLSLDAQAGLVGEVKARFVETLLGEQMRPVGRGDEAGRDRVDPDPVAAERVGQIDGHAAQTGLRRPRTRCDRRHPARAARPPTRCR